MLDRPSWRKQLGSILSSPAERERIANEMSVPSITLMRWVDGDSSPRLHNLQQLLYALPQEQRDLLLP